MKGKAQLAEQGRLEGGAAVGAYMERDGSYAVEMQRQWCRGARPFLPCTLLPSPAIS